MVTTRPITLPIRDVKGAERGAVEIRLLPRAKESAALVDLREEPQRDATLEPVQLLEGEEYGYRFLLPPGIPAEATVNTDKPEIFEPDYESGREGRLRPRLYTGSLTVAISAEGTELGRVAFEVRSAKLDYLRHYRWMLQNIAEELSEALMERFAPSEQRFTLDTAQDAATLYQRFAFLKHLIWGDAFEEAINQILARPHRAWVADEQTRRPGQGLPPGPQVAKQIAMAPGPRMPWPGGAITHIPAKMRITRTEETLDTPENRFIQFSLTRWRDVSLEIERVLDMEKASSPVTRGRGEVAVVRERLDELLAADLFRDVGRLTYVPAGSQVLKKRTGYRDLFRAYLQFEAAAAITWEGGEDVYAAGQRNVAVLYEYWVFLQLAALVADLCGEDFARDSLFDLRPDGLGVRLKRGKQRLLSGGTMRLNRSMHLELWFNKTFGGENSWTRPMRPDCSLRIRSSEGGPATFEDIWLHFDAKYRVESVRDLFGDAPQNPSAEETFLNAEQQAEDLGTARRNDLLKMHAYRDAIRRSAGAFIIYPGAEPQAFSMYHEILPGLGAFALRPTESGEADGLASLRRFLEDVLTHVASQATQHERAVSGCASLTPNSIGSQFLSPPCRSCPARRQIRGSSWGTSRVASICVGSTTTFCTTSGPMGVPAPWDSAPLSWLRN